MYYKSIYLNICFRNHRGEEGWYYGQFPGFGQKYIPGQYIPGCIHLGQVLVLILTNLILILSSSLPCPGPHEPYPVLVLTNLILSSSLQIVSCPRPYKPYPILVLTNLILPLPSQTLFCPLPYKYYPILVLANFILSSSSQTLTCPRPCKSYPDKPDLVFILVLNLILFLFYS